MTAITRNLPWFVKDLGVSIVGEKCYVSLVENLDIGDVDCLKYALSKGLGIGIVVGGSIMKVPQLLLIVSAKSARGLSLSAYVLETLAYAITLAYSLQNIIITLLIIHYPSSRLTQTQSSGPRLALATALTAASGFALYVVPKSTLAALQMATIPLSLFSKLPQIRQNARARSTGQLSAFAVVSQIAGCLARLFTTSAEVGDPILAAGFALALLLNIVLGVQMWAYWGRDGVPAASKHEEREMEKISTNSWQENDKVEVVIQPASPIRPATPTHGRKWARKLD